MNLSQENKKYVLGTILAVFVLLCNQSYIQYSLFKKRQDASLLNVSGRQRMLSQKLNLEIYRYKNGYDNFQEIVNLYSRWNTIHLALIHGNDSLAIPKIDNQQINQHLQSISTLIISLGTYITSESVLNQISIATINSNQLAFLEEMEGVVTELQNDSNRKLRVIVVIEIVLMLLSILILILESQLIYQPIFKKLSNTILDIRRSEATIQQQNDSLKKQNETLKTIAWQQSHEVRRPLANILTFIDLIEKQNEQPESDTEPYLDHLKTSVHELDEIIKSINDKANNSE